MKNLLLLIKKDFIRFLHDKTAVLLTFLVPIILIFLFGNIFGGHGNSRGKATIIFVNESPSLLAKFFEQKLDSSTSIQLKRTQWDEKLKREIVFDDSLAREWVLKGNVSAALIFPPDFFADTSNGLKIKIYSDPKNEIESSMIQGAIQQSMMAQMSKIFPILMQRQTKNLLGDLRGNQFYQEFGSIIDEYFQVDIDSFDFNLTLTDSAYLFGEENVSTGQGDIIKNMIRIEEEQLVGEEIENPQVTRIVGGWAMMFLLFSLTGAATSFFEEKTDGTLKRLLCMPIKSDSIIFGKFIYSVLLGFVQLAVLFFFAWLFFDVDILSNFGNLVIVSFISASAAVAFGMVITVHSESIGQASGYSTFLILVMSSLGGAWFPIFLFPDWMQVISKFTIVYWAVEAFQNVLWRQSSIGDLIPHIAILGSIAIIVNIYAIHQFKKGKMFR